MNDLKRLEEMLTQGKISRRDFMARLSALGIATMFSPALFSNTAHAETPNKGGRLRIGMGGGNTSDSLDPATFSDVTIHTIDWQLRNNLVETDHKGNAVPELAESWEASPGAKQWVFNLRKGIEFHDGKSFGAEDVIFSLNHHRGENSKSAAKVIVKVIKSMKADGKHRVVFDLHEGTADFPFYMTDYHLPIMPAGTTDFDKGIGTGGYILESFNPGVRTFAKRNPNYWKSGRAHFDEVETISIEDVNARVSALVSGSIDVMNRCDRKTATMLSKRGDINVYNVTGKMFATFSMLVDKAPFDNNDVRLAMKYAMDREELVNKILRGYGTLGNDHPISPIMRYHASGLPQRKWDPDKAKYHLKKAGLENATFDLHAAATAFGGAMDAAVLYKEQAKKSGININIVRHPDDGYWNDVWLKLPWSVSRWNGRPTEDFMFSTAYESTAAWNDTHYKDAKFDKLLKEARPELNEVRRAELYAEMQSMLRDEGGALVPMFIDYVEAASTKLKFKNPCGDFDLDGTRLAERWWFGS